MHGHLIKTKEVVFHRDYRSCIAIAYSPIKTKINFTLKAIQINNEA
jgi:hypothetical protein